MGDDPTQWAVRGSRRVYKSRWVNVDIADIDVPGGRRLEHHVVRFPRKSVGATVFHRDRMLLLWRYRVLTDSWGWEIPAGWCDEGESPEDAVRREITEETGYRVAEVRPLTDYHPLSGISPQRYELFLAWDAEAVGEPDPTETSRIDWFTADQARELLARGSVRDGPSLTAIAFVLAIGRPFPPG